METQQVRPKRDPDGILPIFANSHKKLGFLLEKKSDKKNLRTGFTTGACAQAGVKACLLSMLENRPLESVEIVLPIGRKAKFLLHRAILFPAEPLTAEVSIIKDGGDDPDCTHGAEIITHVRIVEKSGIQFQRGHGVGWISKPGLGLPVGDPAINPVPRRYMEKEWTTFYDNNRGWIEEKSGLKQNGIVVTLSIPNGEILSRQTLNSRLGILEGLSILGTKGIVVPFSTSAYRASITQAMDVAVARGIDTLVLTTGGQSEKFAQAILSSLPEESFIQIGDFSGFSIREAGKRPVKKIIMAGLMGKFSKLAMGVTQTHAAGSQVDFGFLASIARESGAPDTLVGSILQANTARHVGDLVAEAGFDVFFEALCKRILVHLTKISGHPPSIGVMLTDFQGKKIGYAES
ncbi:cobalt-precorrin-5B (C(1))-methyltransferase [Leptospirillum ferriphilum]|uniref:Cobalt-precorrin-5B C(1)-methyltransferase n=2 Tax=Leptospirillum ferriphilum TaxID=178606 RepID=A0A059Y1I5_9BACT|nr:cobalt-precorrin-5B (C(1))-methyltransferase [Leptospirillum ferriphilum]AIA31312.1 cobalt-precorrin-6A synthase [Leptospirillum ferriphilum YSK]OOH71607.1 cobalt-precorrin-5B (C(1))-methyltransferase [Leptospirillum ferriphilum]